MRAGRAVFRFNSSIPLPLSFFFPRVADDADLSGKHNMVYMSTGIVGGRAKAIVTGTGMRTALGAIQKDVQDADTNEDTPLQKKIGEFGNQLQVWLPSLVRFPSFALMY